jgi:hypothetical protein
LTFWSGRQLFLWEGFCPHSSNRGGVQARKRSPLQGAWWVYAGFG